MRIPNRFNAVELSMGHRLYLGHLPDTLIFSSEQFKALWDAHPETYHRILIHGREVATPRWQQAYGADYYYTGRVNQALPTPSLLKPILNWSHDNIDQRLNGVLVNWYDASLGHYIGKHRDSTRAMISGSPIVTISMGEPRTFRVRPWKGKGYWDFTVTDGQVLIMPDSTNQAFTHEVPRFSTDRGRRISVTLRAFNVVNADRSHRRRSAIQLKVHPVIN